MTKSIPALATYRETRPCTAKNCSADDLHTLVAASGHNTWGIHSQHLALCDYAAQFRAKGSAVYQLEHVPTGYPAQHDGIVTRKLQLLGLAPGAGTHRCRYRAE